MKLINCTPHAIRYMGILEDITFEPSGNIARVGVEEVELDNYMFVKNKYTEVEGIPEPKEDTLYIVSAMVFAATNRKDVIAPNTNKAFRDELGHIIGVPNFIIK